MKNRKRRELKSVCSAFFLLIISIALPGQTRPVEVVPSSTVRFVDEAPYFIHPVAPGQTLYSIARAYAVRQELILTENPDLANGLRSGQSIRIPARAHVVEPRETPFGLSRRYEITLQQLHACNPDILIEGLKIGMTIYIPGRDEPESLQTLVSQDDRAGLAPAEDNQGEPRLIEWPTAATVPDHQVEAGDTVLFEPQTITRQEGDGRPPAYPCLNATTKDTYHVALLIPLFLGDLPTDHPIDTLSEEQEERFSLRHKSFSFIPYYQGVLLALDSIRDQGFDIRLHVYDVDQEERKARQAIFSDGFSDMDLIIGPFYSQTLRYVSNYAQHHQIPLVSPLLPDRQQLINSPKLFNATPSLEIQLDQLADYIGRHHAANNIIFVHNNQQQALHIINRFKTNLNKQLASRGSNALQGSADSMHDSMALPDTLQEASFYFKELVYIRKGIEGLRDMLEKDRKNVIVTLVSGEAFLSNYLRELNMHVRAYDMEVYGIPDWKDYESVEIDYLQNLKVHIFTPAFQDYSASHIKDFVRKYRSEFKMEPSNDAFMAVHTAYYFFHALGLYGSSFADCMEQLNDHHQGSRFSFFQPFGNSHGWENGFFTLFKYENYRMVPQSLE